MMATRPSQLRTPRKPRSLPTRSTREPIRSESLDRHHQHQRDEVGTSGPGLALAPPAAVPEPEPVDGAAVTPAGGLDVRTEPLHDQPTLGEETPASSVRALRRHRPRL